MQVRGSFLNTRISNFEILQIHKIDKTPQTHSVAETIHTTPTSGYTANMSFSNLQK